MTPNKFDINYFVNTQNKSRKTELRETYLKEKEELETLKKNYLITLKQIEEGNLECYKTAKNIEQQLELPENESTKLINDSITLGFKTLINENTEAISEGNIDTTYQIIRILEELKTNKLGHNIDRTPLGNALITQIDTLSKKYNVEHSQIYQTLKSENKEKHEWLKVPCHTQQISNGNFYFLTDATELTKKYGFSETELNNANNTGISFCQEIIDEIYNNADSTTKKIFDECKTVIDSHTLERPDILLKGYQIIKTALEYDEIKEKILKNPKGYGGTAAYIASKILSDNEIEQKIIAETCNITPPTLTNKYRTIAENLPADAIM